MRRLLPRLTGVNRTAAKLAGVAAVMASLSFAAVPFYDWFCRTTGFAGTTGVASEGSDVILDRTVKIRFDASLERGMPWEFHPVEREMTIRIGETGLAFYEAYNPTDHVVAGTASYNVAPDPAGGYFIKIACFCFEMQVLQPGERVMMPVTFYVDPEMMDDPEAAGLREITLSYTFHETELPKEQAALAPDAEAPVN
jgi:cytochrome c oxidase assembly protein subunit 11